MSVADPLAAALANVLNRRGKNYMVQDELGYARQLREVAQICWMQAGEPKRLREEDGDRAGVCRELLKRKGVLYARSCSAAQGRERQRRLRVVR